MARNINPNTWFIPKETKKVRNNNNEISDYRKANLKEAARLGKITKASTPVALSGDALIMANIKARKAREAKIALQAQLAK